MIKKIFFLFAFWLLSNNSRAQIVTIFPIQPTKDDSITITFNAELGNAGLQNFNSDIYIHTGLITNLSQNNNDWKYVKGVWGTADTSLLMTKIGINTYQFKSHFQDFYGFPNETDIRKIAFVFRNENGTIAGRDVNGEDLFININLNVRSYISHTFNGKELRIKTTKGFYSLSNPTENIVKTAYFRDSTFKSDTGFSVILKNQLNTNIQVDTSFLFFETVGLKVQIQKTPFQLKYISNSDTILREEFGFNENLYGTNVRIKLKNAENIQGGGSRAININRRGQYLEMYNRARYGYTNGASTLNICIPFFISSAGYGLYFDNFSKGYADIGKTENNVFEYGVDTAQLSYFVIAGTHNSSILKKYTELTGRQKIPPRWALGYIQSKYGYQTEAEARTIVNRMLNEGFKLDALVLDLYWFGNPSTMGNLNWDYSNFQQPVKMMKDFDSLGVKTILISETYFTQNSNNFLTGSTNGYFGKNQNGTTFIINNFWAGSSALLDVTNTSALDWMWNFYSLRNNEGVSGWWTDLGEPENHPEEMVHSLGSGKYIHNIYALLWNEMLYKKHKQFFPETRLFNLSRSGFAGMQRFSTFPWSGDIQRSFSGLQAQIPIMLGMSMSGVGYMHSDLGGFTGGSQNNELYTRWLQFGTFTPIMRAHGEGVPTEPVNYPTLNKNIIKNYINLRHEFLPYNYSLAVENSRSGVPLVRPMNYFQPNDPILVSLNDQYFWGDNVLIAPVIVENQTQRNVIFPDGNWIDYWTLNEYNSGSQQMINAPLNKLPFFIRAGSFIPLSVNSTASKFNHNSLRLKYFPDESIANSSITVYDDDGISTSSDSLQAFDEIQIQANKSTSTHTISFSKSGNSFPESSGNEIELIFEIQRISSLPTLIELNNSQLPQKTSLLDFNLTIDSGYFYDQSNSVLYIKNKIDNGGFLTITDLSVAVSNLIPIENSTIKVSRPYPNPFLYFTILEYEILKSGNYTIEILDKFGKLIKTLSQNYKNIGAYSETWFADDLNGTEVSAGSYTFLVKNKNEVIKTFEIIKQ